MKFDALSIPDVVLITPRIFGDSRGFFTESWNQQVFSDAGIDFNFVQDNHSRSQQNVLRGLHYQIQKPQGKLVRVIHGTVFDVAVDLRQSSQHFGKWTGAILSDENKQMLWIPPGFAHGFYVLTESVDFIYKTTEFYYPKLERCVIWNDPDIAINWPIPKNISPLLASKDSVGLTLSSCEVFP